MNAVLAQHQTPVGLRLAGELCLDGIVNTRRPVKFTAQPELIGAGKEIQFLFIVRGRYCLTTSAVFTFGYGLPFHEDQVAPHILHFMIAIIISFSLVFTVETRPLYLPVFPA